MWEWLVLIGCFAVVIFFRIKGFKKAFKKSLEGYSDPYETARDILLKAQKMNDVQSKAYQNIKTLEHLVKLNLGYLENLVSRNEALDKNRCIDLLRKITVYVAIARVKTEGSRETQMNELKILSNAVFPHLEVLKKVRDLVTKDPSNDKDEKFINKSIELYYESLLDPLTPFLFPY